MTNIEMDFMHTMMTGVRTIAKELKRMNKLKAIEVRILSTAHEAYVDSEIDEIMQEGQ